MLKFSGAVIWRLGKRTTIRRYSSSSATVYKTDKPEGVRDLADKRPGAEGVGEPNDTPGLVAAAFAALNSPDTLERKASLKSIKLSRLQQLDTQIVNAADVDGLLKVAENSVVSRRHALKMVSVLSDWSSSNKVKISDFEKDPRFLKLCRILARTPATHAMSSITMADDLSTVLGITGDDEAARLICNLTLSQLVKVLKALQQKGRRSTPLLRALAHNIVKIPESVDLKKCADILYCVAALNFPDPLLMERICSDIIANLPGNTDKSAVVHSIMTSLGLLRYRHEPALAALAEWLSRDQAAGRPGDMASAAVTLATVGYLPQEADSLIKSVVALKEEDLPRAAAWLDLVFSLLILEKATEKHLSSTLRQEFIEKLLATGEIPIPARRKLMAIDAYLALAHPAARGPRLPPAVCEHVPLVYTKEKSAFAAGVMDSFRHLVSAEGFLRKATHQDMGFLYDGEFALDANCRPVPLDKAENNKNVFRIAILSLDYHDMTRRSVAAAGAAQLYSRLLELKGFKVLQVPYTEFNPKDKLVVRVQYIERQLKEIVSSKPAAAAAS